MFGVAWYCYWFVAERVDVLTTAEELVYVEIGVWKGSGESI